MTILLIVLLSLVGVLLAAVTLVLVLPFSWEGEFSNTVGSLRSFRLSWPGQLITWESAVEDGERWTYLYLGSSLVRKKHHPAKPEKAKEEKPAGKKEDTSFETIRFGLRTFRRSFPLLEEVIPAIQLKFSCDLTIGTGDPATTGLMFGVVQAFRALFPMLRLRVRPAFLKRTFRGTAQAHGILPLGRVLLSGYRFYRTPEGKAMWNDIQERRKGTETETPVTDDEMGTEARAAMAEEPVADTESEAPSPEEDPFGELRRQWAKGRKTRRRFFQSIVSGVAPPPETRDITPEADDSSPAAEQSEKTDAHDQFRRKRRSTRTSETTDADIIEDE